MAEIEWYRAESEKTEVFAPLIPIERVWVEEYGVAAYGRRQINVSLQLVSLDDPARKNPISALDSGPLTGRRIVQIDADGHEVRDLRAATEAHAGEDGDICVRVVQELDWYRWAWSGKVPPSLELSIQSLWIE